MRSRKFTVDGAGTSRRDEALNGRRDKLDR